MTFDDLVGSLDYPMIVVTARDGGGGDDGERGGCLVGFSTQCSIDPPRYLVCLSKANRTYELSLGADHLGVHVLGRDDRDTAIRFGGLTGDEVDKFAVGGWCDGPHGVPLLDGCRAWFVGSVVDRFDAGDHVAVVLDPVAVGGGVDGGQLGYHDVADVDPGHDP